MILVALLLSSIILSQEYPILGSNDTFDIMTWMGEEDIGEDLYYVLLGEENASNNEIKAWFRKNCQVMALVNMQHSHNRETPFLTQQDMTEIVAVSIEKKSITKRAIYRNKRTGGTSKNKKNPDRCLPYKKAISMSKAERAKTARKKKREGRTGKQFVSNTKAGKVTKRFV